MTTTPSMGQLKKTLPPTKGQALPSPEWVESYLHLQGKERDSLYDYADKIRHDMLGDEVHLRGIIEFSNQCKRHCDYCGIRGGTPGIHRYRMTFEEIIEQAKFAHSWGFATVVLQSGEDIWFTADRLCHLIEAIKVQTGMAITLSIGERPMPELKRFHEAGCDRYLLRFETSDRALFQRIHPDDDYDERLECIENIRSAGIQVGSGFMIGLPFAGLDVLARDILFATRLDLDMIGCGPFIAHPGTPLAGQPLLDDREIYFKAMALLRLLNPRAHIPATTAFDALNPQGRDLVLVRGGNVFMPNITPVKYRVHYQLYPNKPCVDEDSGQCVRCVQGRIARLKRTIAKGPGHSYKRSEHPRAGEGR